LFFNRLLLVVAFYEEAKSIIDRYKLKTLQDKRFNIYKNENIALIISGVGKINAAIATTYLASLFQDSIKSFLNISVAGYLNLQIGQLVYIYQISDENNKNIFLSNLIDIDLPSKALITVDKPKKDYTSDYVYDMEGAGFFEAASKFSYLDLIYSLKIISDNKTFQIERVTKEMIERLFLQNLETIEKFISKLLELKARLKQKTETPHR
jgi:adenosylhomocysteine nucleosidase